MFQRIWQQLALATNWPVMAAVFVLTGMGIWSIHADHQSDAMRQVVFVGVGLVGMLAFQAFDYRQLGRWSWGFYLVSLLLVIYTVIGTRIPVPGVREVNGSHAWINFGVMSLQPAELLKLAFIMVLARYLRFRSNFRTFRGLLAPFALAVIPMLLILKQPDLGTALTLLPALFAMLFVAGARLKHLFGIVALAVMLAPFAWMAGTDLPFFRHLPELVRPYQRARVMAMFTQDPATLQGVGFQQDRAVTAFGSGGLSGKGAGNIPVGSRVPESHNDMILALIGEQFGFVGTVVLLGAYLVLITAGIEIAGATREPFGRLAALGIIALIAGQMFMNVAVCLRMMPVTGVTLPFVSAGGSSLLASFMAAGLLLNIGQNRPLVVARESFEFDHA